MKTTKELWNENPYIISYCCEAPVYKGLCSDCGKIHKPKNDLCETFAKIFKP